MEARAEAAEPRQRTISMGTGTRKSQRRDIVGLLSTSRYLLVAGYRSRTLIGASCHASLMVRRQGRPGVHALGRSTVPRSCDLGNFLLYNSAKVVNVKVKRRGRPATGL